MTKTLRNTVIWWLVLTAGPLAAQTPVLDSVCSGSIRHYRVDGEAGSTYTWNLAPPSGTPVVLPSTADTIWIEWSYPAGVYTLDVIQHGLNACDAKAVFGEVRVFDSPLVDAGPDGQVCVGRYYKLTGSTAANTGSLQWSTSGDGTFDNDTTLHPAYNPGPDDIFAGTVTLTLTGFGLGFGDACPPSSSVMILEIVTEIVPLFEPIGPLCQFSAPPALPDTSLQGITGYWNPPVINTNFLGTFDYTFTPDDPAQCGIETIIQIQIVSEIIPLFEPIGPLCINSIPPALPDTSLQGITGTWVPPVISTSTAGTFLYNFYPSDPSQCGVPTSIEISVVTEILPLFAPIGPLCQFSAPPALPDTSLQGMTGTWVPPVIPTLLPDTLYFTFTPDPGQCGLTTGLEIIILPQLIPEFEPLGPFCQYTAPQPLPDTSLNGIPGTWVPPVIITAWPGMFTYTFNPDPGICATTATLEITILPEIIPEFEPIGPLCQNSAPPLLPTVSLNGISGTWEPPVISTSATGTFFFTFTPDGSFICTQPVSLAISIIPAALPVFDPIGPLCHNSVPPALPDTSLNGIAGTWSPAVIITSVIGSFPYTFTPDPDECAAEVIMIITIDTEIEPLFAPIGPLCQNSPAPALPDTSLNQIPGTWNPAVINTSLHGTFSFIFTPEPGSCGMPAEIEIVILEEVVPEFEPIEPICQNSTAPVLPPVSENGITGTWDPPVVSTTAPGTFEFTFQPDNPLQCAVSATISITVNPSVIPLFDAIGPLCQGDEAPELPDESLNGISGSWNPAVIQTSVPGTFVFIFTPVELEECGVMTTLEVSVNAPTEPLFDPIGPLSQGSVAPALPSVSLNGVTGTWAPPVIDTSVPGTYEFVFTPDEGQCATTAIMNITVLFDLLEAITGSGEHCVGDAVVVPLAVDNFIHVNTFQLKLNYNVDKLECEGYINAHPQLADSLTGHVNVASGVITLNWHGSAPVTFSQSEIVADLVFTPKEPGQGGLSWYTGATESFFLDPYNLTIPAEFHTAEISIYDPPQIMIESLVQACEGQEVIISGIALGTHPPLVYEWVYPNGHTDTAQPHFAYVTPSNQGHYILRVTDAMHCTDQKSVYLKVSENPVAAFHGSDTLSVPQGYLLDAGSGMESYLWNTGEITAAIVIDTNGMYSVMLVSPAGCQGKDSVYVRITSELPPMCLYIPNAFTPNGDELNDTFKAIAACPIKDFKMLIFNRWGEELYEAYDISQGWDGTKNGVRLPGDAYVYKITYRESNIHDGPERIATGIVILLK